jgi:energy-coupling factor transporter ATP-binding protein EcfA2
MAEPAPLDDDDSDLRLVLDLFAILTNRVQEHTDYFKLWVSHMLVHPGIKPGIMPVIISRQGAGKGTLVKLLAGLIGNGAVFDCENPMRDVFGAFNGMMAVSYLVVLNEVGKAEMSQAFGRLKHAVTDPTVSINEKGLPQQVIRSFHRFMLTTNEVDPVPTSVDDRRFVIFRASDELIGQKQLFDRLHHLIEQPALLAAVARHLVALNPPSNFFSLAKPVTHFQQELVRASQPLEEQWLMALAEEMTTDGTDRLELTGKQSFDRFVQWAATVGNDVTRTYSAQRLGILLTSLNCPGVQQGRHVRAGKTKVFLRDHLPKFEAAPPAAAAVGPSEAAAAAAASPSSM